MKAKERAVRKKTVPNKGETVCAENVERRDFALLAIMGTSPAILTETIWRLAVPEKGGVSRLPSEVVVLSTSTGVEKFRREILAERVESGGKSVWCELLDALERNHGCRVGELRDNVEIKAFSTGKHDAQGNVVEMDDTRNGEDCLKVANQMLEALHLLQMKHEHVVVSIAGGRKAMTALMFSCVTLCGRPTDEVCHVLLDPKYECRQEPTYYHPDQSVQKILFTPFGGAGKPFWQQAKTILPELFFVPFASFRRHYMPRCDCHDWSYSGLVSAHQRLEIDEDPKIVINFREKTIELRGKNDIRIRVGDAFGFQRMRNFGHREFYACAIVCAYSEESIATDLLRPIFAWVVGSDVVDNDVSSALSNLRRAFMARGWNDCESLFPKLKSKRTTVKFNRNNIEFHDVDCIQEDTMLKDAGKLVGFIRQSGRVKD